MFRRFSAPISTKTTATASSSAVAGILSSSRFITTVPSTTAIVAAATTPINFTSKMMQSSSNYNRRDNNNNNNRRDYNRDNRGDASSSSSSSSSPAVFSRASNQTRTGEPFLDLNTPVETAASNQGFRLVIAFPTSNCSFMDIQFSPQVRDKIDFTTAPASEETSSTEGGANKRQQRRPRIFGMPVVPLTVRIYPLQMAKIVAVLEGKANEAVIASRLAVGTFKKGNDGQFVYAVQTRVASKSSSSDSSDSNTSPTSAECALNPEQAFMMEKFLTRMLVLGFDPARDELPRGSRTF